MQDGGHGVDMNIVCLGENVGLLLRGQHLLVVAELGSRWVHAMGNRSFPNTTREVVQVGPRAGQIVIASRALLLLGLLTNLGQQQGQLLDAVDVHVELAAVPLL